MRRSILCLAATVLCLCLVPFPADARDIYVTGVTKITMRRGPGVSNKIVAMLQSGTKLEMINYRKDWSQVKNQEGKMGWVLSRFLTEEIPLTRVVDELRRENERLTSSLDQVSLKNKNLVQKNDALVDIERKYKKLEKASAEFLKLDAKYKRLVQVSEEQTQQIESLEQTLGNDKKIWFLSGAGVFIVGIFLGLSTRKKKRTSLL